MLPNKLLMQTAAPRRDPQRLPLATCCPPVSGCDRSLTAVRSADLEILAVCHFSQRPAFPEPAKLAPMTDAARLLEAALQLAPRERAELVEALTASLDGSDLGEA